ncbi:unnamed protein product [Nezara viridula]|uniref:Neuropeptide n=1 Tax=Nezara viridula TaxID=85310 RepID=A0A9P0HT95_NEZVI|nr:unnamed protein product [Nezara viridula]
MIGIVLLCTISIFLFPTANARVIEDGAIPRTSDIVVLLPDEKSEQIPCGKKCCSKNSICCHDKKYCCMEIGSLPPMIGTPGNCDEMKSIRNGKKIEPEVKEVFRTIKQWSIIFGFITQYLPIK